MQAAAVAEYVERLGARPIVLEDLVHTIRTEPFVFVLPDVLRHKLARRHGRPAPVFSFVPLGVTRVISADAIADGIHMISKSVPAYLTGNYYDVYADATAFTYALEKQATMRPYASEVSGVRVVPPTFVEFIHPLLIAAHPQPLPEYFRT